MKSLFLLFLTAGIAIAADPISDLKQQRRAQGSAAVNVLRLANDAVDAETITIGTQVFEIDTNVAATSTATGGIRITPTGGVLTPVVVGFCVSTAVNAVNRTNFQFSASTIAANEVLVQSKTLGLITSTVAETLGGTNNAWSAAAFYGGGSISGDVRRTSVYVRSCTAVEAALQTMHFILPFTPATALVQVRSVAGVLKAFDGAVVITGTRVDVNASGTTDPASTDVVTLIAAD